MQNNAFQPLGPLYRVSDTPVQCLTTGAQRATSYRVRNVLASASYFSWAPALANGGTPSISTVAPTVILSSPNTIGMIASSVEVFVLPGAGWFASGSGDAFEVTPGEGL